MNKLKIWSTLLLTLGLLLLGAVLPKIAAALQDAAGRNRPSYSDMQALALDFSQERKMLSLYEKLAVLGKGESISISDDAMVMTEDDAFAAAQECMTLYEQAGLFQWFDVSFSSAQPHLAISLENTNNTVLYWTVTYIYKKDPSQTLTLDVDDETGKALRITYHKYGSYSMDGVWERNREVLDRFADIYFTQLGLEEQAAQARDTGDGYEYYERDGEVSNAQYIFTDDTYGEINIALYVEGSGSFFVVFQP